MQTQRALVKASKSIQNLTEQKRMIAKQRDPKENKI